MMQQLADGPTLNELDVPAGALARTGTVPLVYHDVTEARTEGRQEKKRPAKIGGQSRHRYAYGSAAV